MIDRFGEFELDDQLFELRKGREIIRHPAQGVRHPAGPRGQAGRRGLARRAHGEGLARGRRHERLARAGHHGGTRRDGRRRRGADVHPHGPRPWLSFRRSRRVVPACRAGTSRRRCRCDLHLVARRANVQPRGAPRRPRRRTRRSRWGLPRHGRDGHRQDSPRRGPLRSHRGRPVRPRELRRAGRRPDCGRSSRPFGRCAPRGRRSAPSSTRSRKGAFRRARSRIRRRASRSSTRRRARSRRAPRQGRCSSSSTICTSRTSTRCGSSRSSLHSFARRSFSWSLRTARRRHACRAFARR